MSEETKQEPERPKKRKTVLSLPVMIIIGVVVLALLIGGTLFAVNMMVSSIVETKLSGSDSTVGKGHNAKIEKPRSPEDAAMAELEEQEFLGEVPSIYFETGRIITNPRGSTRFLVLNLGLEYREKASEEGGGEEAKKEEGISPERLRLLAKIKDIINSKLGSMTESELDSKRDSLKILIKNDLFPLFKKEKKFLKDVLLVENIIQ